MPSLQANGAIPPSAKSRRNFGSWPSLHQDIGVARLANSRHVTLHGRRLSQPNAALRRVVFEEVMMARARSLQAWLSHILRGHQPPASITERPRRGHATLVLILALLAAAAVPVKALAACGRSGVTVVGSPGEHDEACAALGEVLQYFADGGLAVELRVTIRFQQSVHLESGADAATPLTTVEPIPVTGFYLAARQEIRMTSSTSPWVYQRRPWGLPWDQPLAHSILKHEIAHAVIYQLLGANHRKLPRAWHEALAYAVQIALMAPDLRAGILARYPDRQAFSSTYHINDFVYGVDPDGFAIAAYKTYLRDGEIEFVKRALSLQLEMVDMNDLP
ncbi:DUF6639 family protein [Phreatobacter stygius]|uniref:Uncharacterized protein n=1 Tax=Phreatobacter stygius TaxID=1940610 RepID=A0A4D7AV59_9HYPH|nr:DUF6639 family protein [Phreatobacter stygius]QCI64799.1 hypothetical protein E8M01_11530 [Phreatobacter stygius]